MSDLLPESELDRKHREGLRKQSDLKSKRERVDPQEPLAPVFPEQIDPESNWPAPADERSRNWAPTALILILAAVTLPIFFKMIHTRTPARTIKTIEAPSLLDFIENTSSEQLNQAIEKTVRGFMTATTHEERCRFVRDGLSHLPQMENFYARPGMEASTSFHQIIRTEPASFQGLPVYAVLATAKEGDPALLFHLVPKYGGVCIDWEVSVAYGAMSWPVFLDQKPDTSQQLRVYVKRAPVPLHFPDQSSFYFCLIESRESPVPVTACFPRHTPLAAKLKKIIPPAAQQPVNLELRWNNDLQLVEVTRLIHNFWMEPLEEEKKAN